MHGLTKHNNKNRCHLTPPNVLGFSPFVSAGVGIYIYIYIYMSTLTFFKTTMIKQISLSPPPFYFFYFCFFPSNRLHTRSLSKISVFVDRVLISVMNLLVYLFPTCFVQDSISLLNDLMSFFLA